MSDPQHHQAMMMQSSPANLMSYQSYLNAMTENSQPVNRQVKGSGENPIQAQSSNGTHGSISASDIYSQAQLGNSTHQGNNPPTPAEYAEMYLRAATNGHQINPVQYARISNQASFGNHMSPPQYLDQSQVKDDRSSMSQCFSQPQVIGNFAGFAQHPNQAQTYGYNMPFAQVPYQTYVTDNSKFQAPPTAGQAKPTRKPKAKRPARSSKRAATTVKDVVPLQSLVQAQTFERTINPSPVLANLRTRYVELTRSQAGLQNEKKAIAKQQETIQNDKKKYAASIETLKGREQEHIVALGKAREELGRLAAYFGCFPDIEEKAKAEELYLDYKLKRSSEIAAAISSLHDLRWAQEMRSGELYGPQGPPPPPTLLTASVASTPTPHANTSAAMTKGGVYSATTGPAAETLQAQISAMIDTAVSQVDEVQDLVAPLTPVSQYIQHRAEMAMNGQVSDLDTQVLWTSLPRQVAGASPETASTTADLLAIDSNVQVSPAIPISANFSAAVEGRADQLQPLAGEGPEIAELPDFETNQLSQSDANLPRFDPDQFPQVDFNIYQDFDLSSFFDNVDASIDETQLPSGIAADTRSTDAAEQIQVPMSGAQTDFQSLAGLSAASEDTLFNATDQTLGHSMNVEAAGSQYSPSHEVVGKDFNTEVASAAIDPSLLGDYPTSPEPQQGQKRAFTTFADFFPETAKRRKAAAAAAAAELQRSEEKEDEAEEEENEVAAEFDALWGDLVTG